MDAALPVLELQYVDETGTKGAITVKYPLGTTVAFMDAQATALASLIAPITRCALIRQRIIYKAVETPRSSPDVGSDIKTSGVFIFESEDGESQTLVEVPGILASKIVTSGVGEGVLIDTGDSDIIAFIDEFVAQEMTNTFAVVCAELVAAYRQSRV